MKHDENHEKTMENQLKINEKRMKNDENGMKNMTFEWFSGFQEPW